MIKRTTKNEAIDIIRHEKLQPKPMEELKISSINVKAHSGGPGYNDLQDTINNSGLPKRYKEVLLKLAETGSVTITANYFSLSPGRISIIKQRAVELLKKSQAVKSSLRKQSAPS